MTTRRFISLCLMLIGIVCLSLPITSFAASDGPSDVPEKYKNEVHYLLHEDIIDGYPDGTFRPKKAVTRAETAAMIGRTLDLDSDKVNSSFDDVKQASFASGYIESAYKAGIIAGVGKNKFAPNRPITREEMAALLVRAYGLENVEGDIENQYKDVDSDSQFYNAIHTITSARIAQGNPDNTYNPTKAINRDEFSLMVSRAVKPAFKPCMGKCQTETQYVTAYVLNIRSGPDASFNTIDQLKKDTPIKVKLGQESKWAELVSGNGYVHTGYLTSDKPVEKPKQKVVALDAGHGGSQPGASGNGLIEKNVNLEVTKRVKNVLEGTDIKPVMVRKEDTKVKLKDRAPIAVNKGADTFVSIHSNYHPNPRANGTETYFYKNGQAHRDKSSEKLAGIIQNDLYHSLKTTNRGVKQKGFRVVKENSLPAVLVELAFLSNPSDANKLKHQKQEAAEAIAEGIIKYYEE